MLFSLAAVLVMFTWVGYILFSIHYLPTNNPPPLSDLPTNKRPTPPLGSRSEVALSGRFADENAEANINVDLSTFPRALQSLFVLLNDT